MELQNLSGSYAVRRLCETDVEILYELMRKNTVFYQYHPPFVTRESILADMSALPPGKSAAEKYYIGFFASQTLVAVMDLILAYPEPDIAWIGFFMTDVRCQGRGVGSAIVRDVCACLQAAGYPRVRLGVDYGNPQSYAFWTKNQFHPLREAAYLLMERTAPPKPAISPQNFPQPS